MDSGRKFVGLVVAAGSGSRFGGEVPKQYRLIRGRPVVYHSIFALSSNPYISKVNVVLAPDDMLFGSFNWGQLDSLVIPLYVGGASRAESVKKGLLAMSCRGQDWVIVHDGARPCLSKNDLDEMLHCTSKTNNGVVLGRRVSDTIKKGDSSHNRIVKTISRNDLWCALTPQIFEYDLLKRALSDQLTPDITDESSAVEKIGVNPVLIESKHANPKITFNDDLALAESILKNRENP